MTRPTIKEVFDYGKCLEHCPCDEGENGELESNGTIQYIIQYKGKCYCIITSWDGKALRMTEIEKD